MQDNARPHAFTQIQQYLADFGIYTVNWIVRSPALNPIEHVWDNFKRAVFARNRVPTRSVELIIALTQEWDNVQQYLLKNFIGSMRIRLESVTRARGGNTIIKK